MTEKRKESIRKSLRFNRKIKMSYKCPICGRIAIVDDYDPNGEYLGREYMDRSNWLKYYKCKNCGKRYCLSNGNE